MWLGQRDRKREKTLGGSKWGSVVQTEDTPHGVRGSTGIVSASE